MSLRVKGLCNFILKNVTFNVNEGEILGIVGQSGSGKSTLAKALMGLCPADQGEIYLGETDILKSSPKQWQNLRQNALSLIFQDTHSSLNPTMRIGPQICEAHISCTKDKALALLNEVGIRNPSLVFRQFPHELSGGMRQRVLIAIALASSPSLIIADEPTSALDRDVQYQILRLLKSLKGSLIFITHDLSLVPKLCDRVLMMKEGQIVKEANPSDAALLKSLLEVHHVTH